MDSDRVPRDRMDPDRVVSGRVDPGRVVSGRVDPGRVDPDRVDPTPSVFFQSLLALVVRCTRRFFSTVHGKQALPYSPHSNTKHTLV